jgi:hypothetical protein
MTSSVGIKYAVISTNTFNSGLAKPKNGVILPIQKGAVNTAYAVIDDFGPTIANWRAKIIADYGLENAWKLGVLNNPLIERAVNIPPKSYTQLREDAPKVNVYQSILLIEFIRAAQSIPFVGDIRQRPKDLAYYDKWSKELNEVFTDPSKTLEERYAAGIKKLKDFKFWYDRDSQAAAELLKKANETASNAVSNVLPGRDNNTSATTPASTVTTPSNTNPQQPTPNTPTNQGTTPSQNTAPPTPPAPPG